MNYRHVYHAGNFADVFKHAILALCVEHLKLKPAPFRIIDTHAGIGLYDLAGVEAGKTLEWIEGIGRLLGADAAPLPPDIAAILAPWLDVVRALNPDGRLTLYPGSPVLARRLMRESDMLVVNELHPADHGTLSAVFARDARTKVMALDAWVALKALLPPKERRGIVLVDPPFEAKDEFDALATGLAEARRRFATGTILLWYPVKDVATVEAFYAAVGDAAGDKSLRTELMIRAPQDPLKLNGCGMLVVNPPWTLKQRLDTLLPVLAERLARGAGASWRASDLRPAPPH